MNKERILALAELIESQPKAETPYAARGFSMRRFRHDCGTPSCIGGFASELAKGEIDERDDEYCAQQWLGLSDAQAKILFYPPNENKRAWNADGPFAAQVLRNFVETGVVDWEL